MKIGLALAGGGLQGIAHIGAIKALDELGIKFDYISGTSSGSIFALLYALGFSPDEMIEVIENNYQELSNIEKGKVIKIIKDYLLCGEIKTEGLMNGNKVENIVNQIISKKNIQNISDIKIPLAIPTVDTISTKECIFLSKPILKNNEKVDYIYDIPVAKAIRASMAFPGIYNTCDYKQYNFIDGGTKDNLPVAVLKDMGADFTIGISFSIEKYNPSKNFFNVMLRAVDIFSQKDVINAQKIADIAVEIDTDETSLLEIDNIKKCVYMGYDTIRNNQEKIIQKIITNSNCEGSD